MGGGEIARVVIEADELRHTDRAVQPLQHGLDRAFGNDAGDRLAEGVGQPLDPAPEA
jgi:hypothetical protein